MAGLKKILQLQNIDINNYDVFIETGLYDASNIASMFSEGYFSNIEKAYSIELNKDFVDKAFLNYPFLKNEKINLVHGDSGIALDNILKENSDKKVLLWLDAHYSGGPTAKSENYGECPLIGEIEAIKNLKNKPTIIIDDLGCLLKDTPYYYNGWPTAHDVINLSKKYFEFDVFLSERDESQFLHYAVLK
jgi:hypothetical protein